MPLNIQVGQQWRTRGGDVVTVTGSDPHGSVYIWDLSDFSCVTADGWEAAQGPGEDGDLIELVSDAPAHSQRLTVAAAIYAAMLTTAKPVAPDDAVQALRDLARRALSHADILIQESSHAA